MTVARINSHNGQKPQAEPSLWRAAVCFDWLATVSSRNPVFSKFSMYVKYETVLTVPG